MHKSVDSVKNDPNTCFQIQICVSFIHSYITSLFFINRDIIMYFNTSGTMIHHFAVMIDHYDGFFADEKLNCKDFRKQGVMFSLNFNKEMLLIS